MYVNTILNQLHKSSNYKTEYLLNYISQLGSRMKKKYTSLYYDRIIIYSVLYGEWGSLAS